MPRLNNKGFTLVELLAVVVVLSIVVGLTVPVATNLVTNARYKALMITVEEAEKFTGDQWKLKRMDKDMMNTYFGKAINGYSVGDFITLNVNEEDDKNLINEMGIHSEGVKTVFLKIYEKNIPCVVIGEIYEDSKLYDAKYWKKTVYGGETFAVPIDSVNDVYYSKCCLLSDVQKMLGNRYGA